MFEKIENIIVLVSRGILIVLAIFALISGVISFFYGLNLTLPKIDEQNFKPIAKIEKFDQGYITLKEQSSEEIDESNASNLIPSEEIELAKKIQRNLARNFKNQSDSSRYITLKNSYEFRLDIMNLKEFLGIELQDKYLLEILLELSSESENSYVLDRVILYDDIDSILDNLLTHLMLEISLQYNDFMNEKIAISQSAERNKNLGYSLMLYSSIGITVFIIIIL